MRQPRNKAEWWAYFEALAVEVAHKDFDDGEDQTIESIRFGCDNLERYLDPSDVERARERARMAVANEKGHETIVERSNREGVPRVVFGGHRPPLTPLHDVLMRSHT